MTDTIHIRLRNCSFFGRHGVLESEADLGQRFFVDIDMEVLPTRPLAEDDLASTVDYGAVFELVRRVVETERFALIEALADCIGRSLIADFAPVRRVTVTVRKPSAPIAGILDYAEVSVVCTA